MYKLILSDAKGQKRDILFSDYLHLLEYLSDIKPLFEIDFAIEKIGPYPPIVEFNLDDYLAKP